MSLDSARSSEDYFEDTLESLSDFFKSIDYSGSRMIGNFIEETGWEDYWFQDNPEEKMPCRSKWEILRMDEDAGRQVFQELEEEGYLKELENGYTVPLETVDTLWYRLNDSYDGQRSLDIIEKSIREEYDL